MSDDKIVVQCHCGKRYKASADKVGKQMKCKVCGDAFIVQAVSEAGEVPLPIFGSPSVPELPRESNPSLPLRTQPVIPKDETSTMPVFGQPAAVSLPPLAATPSAVEPARASTPNVTIQLPVEDEESQDVVDRPPMPRFRLKPVNKLKLDDSAPKVNPDELMADIQASQLSKTLAIALVIHLVLLGATSASFIPSYLADGKKYGSYDLSTINVEKKKEEELKKKEERDVAAKKRREEREAQLKKINEELEVKKKEDEAKKKEEEKKKLLESKVGRDSLETSDERPGSSGVSLFGGQEEL